MSATRAAARRASRLTRAACADSAFIQTTFSTGYPRLLRLFHEFFSKIAVHTDTVYTQQQQRYAPQLARRRGHGLRHAR